MSSSKNKPFVRPTASKPWYFTCSVCTKPHYKWGSHNTCYKRWCDMCQIVLKTPEELKEHALKWHKQNFCDLCNMTVTHLKKHKTNFH